MISHSSLLFPRSYQGAQGLAEDVRYYGRWMRDEAEKRIGHLYPKIKIPPLSPLSQRGDRGDFFAERPDLIQYAGKELTVIAWLWARTVKSPNPAFANVDVPLASTFMLSTKPGKEAYVEVVREEERGERGVPSLTSHSSSLSPPPPYRFTVKVGKPKDMEAAKTGTKLARGANFKCVMSGIPISGDYIKAEGKAGRMGARLMAIVAEGDHGRVYLSPTPEHEKVAGQARPGWRPEGLMPDNARWFSPPLCGLSTWGALFTPRQLVALTTFSDLVGEAMERVKRDALASRTAPTQGGSGPFQRPSLSAPTPSSPQEGEHPSRPSSASPTCASSPKDGSFSLPPPRSAGGSPSSPQRGEVGRGEQSAPDPANKTPWHPTPIPTGLLLAARELRKSMTDAEQLLWKCLRGKQLDGFKFRKQHPIERYVLDFYCPSHKLAIELDGGQHHTEEAGARDEERSAWLAQQGIHVLRFWNSEVFENIEGVLERIWECLHSERPQGEGAGEEPPPQPSPAGGGSPCDDTPLADGGTGARAYAEAVGVYLGCAVDYAANYWSVIATPAEGFIRGTFARQALPMTWDYAEAPPFGVTSGNWMGGIEWAAKAMEAFPNAGTGEAEQADAATQSLSAGRVVSTDPPYYDNIGYADLSDFFYVWLRRSLRPVFPNLFVTLAVPKAEELVATPYRHGTKKKAEAFFLDGMTQAMHRLGKQTHPAYPVTIYYAFKQAENLGTRASSPQDGATGTVALPGMASTGWDTFLAAVIEAGFAVTGTWPMRTERGARSVGIGTNALASSIILVCRKRPADAPTATRREFVTALKSELPVALAHLQRGNIAPVDLAQAAIGPGMAVYTRYGKVLDAEGKPVAVRDALALINQTLDEVLAEQEGDFDPDTRWALAWFEQYGFSEGEFGVAETLSKAKNTSVGGIVEAGLVHSKGGKVRLLKPDELAEDWDPARDRRLTVWEMVHQLVRALTKGEEDAAELAAQLGTRAETARELAYRLYTLCERKKRAAEALSYNALVQSWPEIVRLAQEKGRPPSPVEGDLFDSP